MISAYLIEPQARPHLETVDIVRGRARDWNVIAQAVDPDRLRDRLIPSQDFAVQLLEILTLEVANEH